MHILRLMATRRRIWGCVQENFPGERHARPVHDPVPGDHEASPRHGAPPPCRPKHFAFHLISSGVYAPVILQLAGGLPLRPHLPRVVTHCVCRYWVVTRL